jgi:hypothetical protein
VAFVFTSKEKKACVSSFVKCRIKQRGIVRQMVKKSAEMNIKRVRAKVSFGDLVYGVILYDLVGVPLLLAVTEFGSNHKAEKNVRCFHGSEKTFHPFKN